MSETGSGRPGVRPMVVALVTALLSALLGACSPVYVIRAGIAEAKLLSRRESIADLLERRSTPPPMRRKLELVQDARTFAKQRLGLDVGDSYTTYATVESDTLMLVLSAARKDRFQQVTWWFPIVGRVPYKGYFEQDRALDAARDLERRGYDAYVRPTSAFSTLGWFSDPLLSTVLAYPDVDLVSTVVHELTHNTIYIASQAGFNESFANFVGQHGAIDYFCTLDGGDAERCLRARQEWHDDLIFGSFMEDLVHRLEALYRQTDLGRAEILRRRQAIFDDAKRRFQQKVQPQFELITYQSFLTMPLNNATLIARRLYYDRLEVFEAAYHRMHDDLPATIRSIVVAAKAHGDEPYAAVAAIGAASPSRSPKKWKRAALRAPRAGCEAARRRDARAHLGGAPTTQAAPCRRNPKGAGGLRPHSSLLVVAIALL